MDFTYTILIPLIPLAVFLILGINSLRIKGKLAGWAGTSGLLISTLLSFYTAYQYFFKVGKVGGVYQTFVEKTVWMHFTDTLAIDIGVLIDPISVMMLIVVSTVSLMVHLYSRGYMHGDSGITRFFAYLSLFSFSMYGLVLATNLFQIYIFWELVGASSFLLIGYYYSKPSAVAAAKKAFIVTRFADFGFLIGILMIGFYTGTFDFLTLNSPVALQDLSSPIMQNAGITFMGFSVITTALVLIFVGGAGKSAMMPFHIWLPDAMEGPTPVSALIHAATMVVAGVYLVARLFPMYYFIEGGAALHLVAYVGALSSLFAAVIALTQNDIKRILAFSTMSQIGYLMMALGVSGYGGIEGLGFTASMFHLFTHAMFKALLFLCAGSVIHSVHTNNLQEMGGLRKYLPVTNVTFLIAALAIAGVPPFAGFFSKDEILAAAFESNQFLFWIEWIVAGLTAFYMFRLYFGIFWGRKQVYAHTPHESPLSMTLPLIFLAIMSAIAGFIPFSKFISPDYIPYASHLHLNIALMSVGIGLLGIIMAGIFYKRDTSLPFIVASSFGFLYKWASNKFYFDELYLFITRKIIFKRIAQPFAWFDRNVVDGTINLIGDSTVAVSTKMKGIQSGKIQDYAFMFISGMVVMVMVVVYFIS